MKENLQKFVITMIYSELWNYLKNLGGAAGIMQ